jgi:PAS domain S-box-containing protein
MDFPAGVRHPGVRRGVTASKSSSSCAAGQRLNFAAVVSRSSLRISHESTCGRTYVIEPETGAVLLAVRQKTLKNTCSHLILQIILAENKSDVSVDRRFRNKQLLLAGDRLETPTAGRRMTEAFTKKAFAHREQQHGGESPAAEYARSLIEASLDPLVTINPEGKITDVNEATVKVTGLARDRLIGTDFSDYFIEPAKAREGYQQVFSKGFVTDYPLTIRHKDGALTDVLYNASLYRDTHGDVLGAFAAARDVTAQKHAAEYARSLIEAALDPMVTISAEGKITDVNEATIKVTGLPRDRLIGTDFSDYFTDPAKAREGYQQVFSQGFVTDYPLTIRHKDGGLTDVLYNASVYRDARGNVLGVFAAARDMTAQKHAAQYARSLIEASLDPLVTISPEGKITDVNEATIKVTGLRRDRLIGTDFSDYFTEPAKAREGYRQVFSQGFVTDYPLTIRHKDGGLTDVLYNASVYRDARGNVLGVFAAARDVTAQKRAEAEVAAQRSRELERLAELERFQKLTVGRELKMIELKKEIAELKQQLTQYAP